MVLSKPGRIILLIRKHRQVDYMLLYDLSSANENGLSRLLKFPFLLDEADTQTNNIANDSRVDVDLHSNRQLHLSTQQKTSGSILTHDLSRSRV
jgi:hypothetical protein